MDPIYESYKQVTEAYKPPQAEITDKEFVRYWVKADMTQLRQLDNVFKGLAAWIRPSKMERETDNDAIIDVTKSKVKEAEGFFRRQHIEVEEKREMKFQPYLDTAWDDHGQTVSLS